VPKPGIEVRWSSNEIVVVDLEKGTSVRKPLLDTKPMIGGEMGSGTLIDYGKATGAHITFRPLIRDVELRFPPVIVTGRGQVSIPAIQYHDKLRAPILVPLYHE
jgi:hypothetical protein